MNYLEICIFIVVFYLLLKNVNTSYVVENMSNIDGINQVLDNKFKINDIREFYDEWKKFSDGEKQYDNIIVNGKLEITESFNQLPKGCILPYHGLNIPPGWALCNGENRTPDLRSRFIIGVGTDVPNLKNRGLNDKGGTDTHTLTTAQMPQHNHTKDATHVNYTSADADPPHRSEGGGQYCYWGANDRCFRPQAAYTGSHVETSDAPVNTFTYSNTGSHIHTASHVGKDVPHNNMPPFLVLTFIMKTSE